MKNPVSFNSLSFRNFLSFGNDLTTVDLSGNRITVVLGVNHDTGGNDSRNGVGKSAIVDAFSYALFGKSIRGVSNARLVNKLISKGQSMLVSLDFHAGDKHCLVERGESPSKLALFVKDKEDARDFHFKEDGKFAFDVSRSKAETTKDIEEILGFDFDLFEILVANTSEATAFAKLPEEKRKDLMENLLGLNLLSERADNLKEARKEQKKALVAEESALEATKEANERVSWQIKELEEKSERWKASNKREIEGLKEKIKELEGIDVEKQIETLKFLENVANKESVIDSSLREISVFLDNAENELSSLRREYSRVAKRTKELEGNRENLAKKTCYTCGQEWNDAPQERIEEIEREIEEGERFLDVDSIKKSQEIYKEKEKQEKEYEKQEKEKEDLLKSVSEISEDDLRFDSVEEASKATVVLAEAKNKIGEVEKEKNPYLETMESLKEQAVVELDYGKAKDMKVLIDHQNYLINLLQSKESFLRKAVIHRWLPKLNERIASYLETLDFPFSVSVKSDLSMSIGDARNEYDWGNLSRGQRQRVSIALNLSFQDLYEATNRAISVLFVDELLDAGMCSRGASQSLEALAGVCGNKGKRIFLVTHRTDIADRIEDVMTIEMKNKTSKIAAKGG